MRHPLITLIYTKEVCFADDLCVAADDVALTGFDDEDSLHAAGLFNLNDKTVEYGYKLYDKLYPASTTKLMTAYLAFKYGNMDDIVTVSDSVSSFASDEVVCNLQPGDTVTLYDLLCGLYFVQVMIVVLLSLNIFPEVQKLLLSL